MTTSELTKTEDFSLSAELFRDAMRNLASGVSLITIPGVNGEPQGMLATAVSSVTAAPPTVLICVQRTATMYDALIAGGSFCVNFLGQHHLDLAKRFSDPTNRQSRFQFDNWLTLHTGAPVLEDALSSLDCSVLKVVEVGSHDVIFGQVLAARGGGCEPPLVYFNRNYGGFADIRDQAA
ncbi:flavin reductase [Rhizobium leguminosarum]|uniref:flavin reductase n=1 Tax=Rhizobium leguminosarum TaxID=384 RepID=UPI0024A8CC7F|nr:flavin reductase [Rhizobium leguminosarum]MDI5929578.1 flavin reductase [Rhizobium leguminosarum]